MLLSLAVITDLLHTLTPTPVPFRPQGMTPASRAMRCNSGTAREEAVSDGDPNMIVKLPFLAATVPIAIQQCQRSGKGKTHHPKLGRLA